MEPLATGPMTRYCWSRRPALAVRLAEIPLRNSWIATVLVLGACISESERMKIRANGVKAGIAGVQGHFEAEGSSFCEEATSATTPITPPLDRNCSRGCGCAGPQSKAPLPKDTYDCNEWDAPEWKRLKFAGSYSLDGRVLPTVYFHHQASWHRTEDGCQLDFTVYGDLDEDGVYSTYTSTLEIRPDGPVGNRPDDSVLLE